MLYGYYVWEGDMAIDGGGGREMAEIWAIINDLCVGYSHRDIQVYCPDGSVRWWNWNDGWYASGEVVVGEPVY